jgi:peptidoglycan/xylan/chitin deacetylase (PgdA/CDA1 family)
MAIASLSLDLDNEWSYLKTHGDPSWESYPTYLDVAVPRFLRLLKELDLRLTVFVVGRDAADPRNHDAIASIAAAGHEVGNHSFRHEPWFHLYSESEIEEEVAQAEEHIQAVTGIRPEGFRGPGYSLSEPTLRVLLRRGYRFDASTLPTFLGPLARFYYFRTARLSEEEREQRKILFGSLADGLRPLRPYRWRLPEGALLEIPVTTLPLLRVPFHLSYVLYASTYSPALANAYFRTALACCRIARLEPSLLLHPLDFLGAEDAPSLSFFPAMQMSAEDKLRRMRGYLQTLRDRFEVIPLGEHCQRLSQRALRELRPHFDADRRPVS